MHYPRLSSIDFLISTYLIDGAVFDFVSQTLDSLENNVVPTRNYN